MATDTLPPLSPEALEDLLGPIQTLFQAFHDHVHLAPEFPPGPGLRETGGSTHGPAAWMIERVKTPTHVHLGGIQHGTTPEELNDARLGEWFVIGKKVRNLLKDIQIPYVMANKLAVKHNEAAVVAHWNHAFGAPMETLLSILQLRFPGAIPAGTSFAALPEFNKAFTIVEPFGMGNESHMTRVDKVLALVKPEETRAVTIIEFKDSGSIS